MGFPGGTLVDTGKLAGQCRRYKRSNFDPWVRMAP